MGMFDKVQEKQASSDGGNFIVPGHYILRIDRVKAGTSQSGKGDFVAVEMVVLDVLSDGSIPLDSNFEPLGEKAWHSVGEAITHLMMAKYPSFEGNVKAFIMGVGDVPEDNVTPEMCESVCDGLFEGLFVEVRARTIKTTKNKPFTKVSYAREVTPSDLGDMVSESNLERVLGAGKIDELIEAYEAE